MARTTTSAHLPGVEAAGGSIPNRLRSPLNRARPSPRLRLAGWVSTPAIQVKQAELRDESALLGAASVEAGGGWLANPVPQETSHPDLCPTAAIVGTLDQVVGRLTTNPKPDLATLVREILG